MSRPNSSCERCRDGAALRGSRHAISLGDGSTAIEVCPATCASCSRPIVQGDLIIDVNTPGGVVEVHESCM